MRRVNFKYLDATRTVFAPPAIAVGPEKSFMKKVSVLAGEIINRAVIVSAALADVFAT